ncbi:hypothetical protein KI387_009315, partial [Taxus chinensis]
GKKARAGRELADLPKVSPFRAIRDFRLGQPGQKYATGREKVKKPHSRDKEARISRCGRIRLGKLGQK